ncbi:MAG TPA: copper amine oxidase N-terminal domain-containing protein [Candidatus Xenobia bacterium]|jgi:hypothetical protein
MQKILFGLAALMAVPALAQQPVGVTVNGNPVTFDQPPVMSGGRVLVPLRGVFERLGATVTWNAATRSIVAQTGSTQVDLAVGSTQATVNGQAAAMDSPPILVNARAMVPLRFVSQALGATVNWDANQQRVAILGGTAVPPSVTYAPPAPAQAEEPSISRINLNSHHLGLGQDLRVTMYGTPGGRAEFGLNGQTGFAMREASAGVYQGEYRVRPSDLNPEAIVRCRLTLENGQTVSLNADRPVALQGREMGQERRLIGSVVDNAAGQTLHLGQELQVTMRGVPGGQAFFEVGNHQRIPMHEVSNGTYVGSMTVGMGDVYPDARVRVHLRTGNGDTAEMLAPAPVSMDGRIQIRF